MLTVLFQDNIILISDMSNYVNERYGVLDKLPTCLLGISFGILSPKEVREAILDSPRGGPTILLPSKPLSFGSYPQS